MEESVYTRVTLELHDEEFPEGDKRVIWEVPFSELRLSDILDCVRTLMVGATYSEETFKKMLVEYVSENRLMDR